MTSGGLLGVWGKWVKHAKYIYNIQDFNPEQVFIELFPRGNCGVACDLLGRYLLEQAGVRSWYTSGKIGSESHVWLTLENGDIVDITGDQYKNREGSLYYDLPVYVGKIDAFHSQFKLNGDPVEITPNDWTPDFLGEDRMQQKRESLTRRF